MVVHKLLFRGVGRVFKTKISRNFWFVKGGQLFYSTVTLTSFCNLHKNTKNLLNSKLSCILQGKNHVL